MSIRTLLISAIVFALSVTAFGQKTISPPGNETVAKSAAKLPTAAQVLENYSKAIGGREAAMKIKSRTYKGKAMIAQANISGTVESFAKPEAMSLTVMKLSGLGDFVQGYDGKTAWASDPIQGDRVLAGEELARQETLAAFYREQDLGSAYSKLEVTGIEAVDGSDAYVLRGTRPNSDPDILYFDVKTGFMVRSDMTAASPAGRVKSITILSDYREVDGIKFPFRTVTKLPQFDIVITLDEVKHNVTVDNSMFAPPAAKGADVK